MPIQKEKPPRTGTPKAALNHNSELHCDSFAGAVKRLICRAALAGLVSYALAHRCIRLLRLEAA
jgi:hypothetical protein